MKIGIMTFWWDQDNYGQLLQCYALQKYLRDRNHEVFLIRYNYENDTIKKHIVQLFLEVCNPIKVAKYLIRKMYKTAVLREQSQNNRHFDDFRTHYILQSENIYPTYVALRDNPPEADCYIVGSDQVWNYWFTNVKRFYNQIHAYFLDFGSEKIKRISYAASWGVTSIPEKAASEIAPLLKKFDYISVREESGMKLCADCCRKDSEWVCDPTLLLSAEKYREIYKENEIRKIEKPFLLLYMLSNQCDFNIQNVYEFAQRKNLEVVYVTGNGVIDVRKKYFATIPEWLYLVDNAKYVISNSFHCAVFCTIFNRQFGVIKLSGNKLGMNTRFDSFFEQRGIAERYITDSDYSVLDLPYEVKEICVSKRFLTFLETKLETKKC